MSNIITTTTTTTTTIDLGYAQNVGCANSRGESIATTWQPGDAQACAAALAAELRVTARYLARGVEGIRADFAAQRGPVLSSRALDAFEARWFASVISCGSAPRRSIAWRIALCLPKV